MVAIQTLHSLNFKSNTLLSKCQRTIIVILIILIINVLNTLKFGFVISDFLNPNSTFRNPKSKIKLFLKLPVSGPAYGQLVA